MQDSGCVITHHTHIPNMASTKLKRPTNRSISGNFLKTRVKPGQPACQWGGSGCDPLGQPVVSVTICWTEMLALCTQGSFLAKRPLAQGWESISEEMLNVKQTFVSLIGVF